MPKSTLELSLILNHIISTNTTFAIKSGGHSSVIGSSNTNATGAVTIDLSDLHEIEISRSENSVWLGTGLRWREVYHALHEHNLSVAGARDADVGVGGYLLGGGMSWYANQVGWACDSVLEYEVVIANGSVVTASPLVNNDLYWALKGGMNAFGVVTKFKIPIVQGDVVFGAGIEYEEEEVHAVIQALQEQTASATSETFAIGCLSFMYFQKTKSRAQLTWWTHKATSTAQW